MTVSRWKNLLADRIPADWGAEIDAYEEQMQLCKMGKLEPKIFAELRLRRGAYGQRYDNGQRHDGTAVRELTFGNSASKGPGVHFDAPGMQRIKVPYGAITPVQLETIAELAEEYSDGILHVTTRQDIQLHFVHIEDTPDLMRRLAAVGITTREACGNSIRNVTGCPLAGVCRTESFDTTRASHAAFRFLLGHKDCQDFGRKFKLSFSGCAEEACAMARMHDLGLVARKRDGIRGFEVHVGGGLGPVPYQASLLYDFLPQEELLPVTQAVARVFARLGEKKNRGKARIKFLVAKLGIDEFRRLVEAERAVLPHDDRWTDWIDEDEQLEERALKPAAPLDVAPPDPDFARWRATNVMPQAQPGYVVVKIALPLGDFTAQQARALADIARIYTDETAGMRTTVDQNLYVRWVPEAELPDLHRMLQDIGLAGAEADTIVDVVSCPGTDTCKLGISASRGLARELRERLAARQDELDIAIRGLSIKVSGCFNSCSQHHVADIGFYGVSRKRHGYSVPHFQMLLGGQTDHNAHSYGLPQFAIPSKRVPEAIDRLIGFYARERHGTEPFQDFIKRVGKAALKQLLGDLTEVAPHDEAAELYTDWGDPREYTTSDIGKGECAGEVVDTVDFAIAEAERLAFDGQIALDERDVERAMTLALQAMLTAAKGLVFTRNIDIGDDPITIATELRTRLIDAGAFAGLGSGRHVQYLFEAIDHPEREGANLQAAHRRVEEATLFIEAAHECRAQLQVEASS